MIKRICVLLLLVVCINGLTFGQTPKPSPVPQKPDDVIKISTNLVQLDVVVTDKEGKPVTDLKPDDFEVTEDKSKQTITNFSYITLDADVSGASDVSSVWNVSFNSKPVANTRVAPAIITPEQVHRTIALVVDDLGLSYESIASVKAGLRTFVNEQMSPTDLVAVLRTSRGIGSLQQFTTDKAQLLAAVEQISWFASGRSGLSPNADIDTQITSDLTQGAQNIAEVEEARVAEYSVGTIQTVRGILRGLQELPGRKSVTLYAESFKVFASQGRNIQLLRSLEHLTDEANRASTVIYTIDASGLNPHALGASDKVLGSSLSRGAGATDVGPVPVKTTNKISNQTVDAPYAQNSQAKTGSAEAFRQLDLLTKQRELQQDDSRMVLAFLAEETGGTFTRNNNDLSIGTQRMLQDQQGYYLIGYRPADSTVDPATGLRQARNISVKLKRSGLKLRSRSGYYGIVERAKATTPLSRDQQLARALLSPFAAGGIGLRITPIWGSKSASGSHLTVLLHVKTKDLSFTEQADGSKSAEVDFLAVSYGNEGSVVDQFSDTQSINVTKDVYQKMVDDGLVFILNVPLKKAGPIQVRVAVRDTKSERIGSANQFLQIPDLGNNNLALSGIYLSGTNPAPTGEAAATSDKKPEKDVTAGPAVRRLRHGMMLSYSYSIYNAKLDETKRPQLQAQMRLFKDGKEIFTGKPTAFKPGQQTDMKNLDAGGRLMVGSSLVPGQYVLQVTVTDALVKSRRESLSTNWIDFEVVSK